ncbi:MAG: aldo/keto reductase [Desulfobacterales bacterium]|nr:aldo/keto reductase [Desulfobacterales bacterium]
MKYRRFGRLDWQVSALGFGAMRLPVTGNDRSKIDEPEALRMIHYAFDHGVNYIDTAWPYHNGNSESLVGRALKNGYRQKVKLATKLPARRVETADDFDRFLNTQLSRLQTDHIDFYLLHGLTRASWSKVRDLDVFARAERAINDGRIGCLGFSFHDGYEVFKEIIDGYDRWTLCQIQYNYMDTDYQAGTKGLRYAAEKGLAVVVMEPIRGGQLSSHPPEAVVKLWQSAPERRSPAEWALQWVWNHPEVSTVLSGMSAMEHVVENVAAADRSGPHVLARDELARIDRVKGEYRKGSLIPCTNCRYCLPCPNNVDIPGILQLYNDALIFSDLSRARHLYPIRIQEDERAGQCTQCRQCEALCPQGIAISEWLEKARELVE